MPRMGRWWGSGRKETLETLLAFSFAEEIQPDLPLLYRDTSFAEKYNPNQDVAETVKPWKNRRLNEESVRTRVNALSLYEDLAKENSQERLLSESNRLLAQRGVFAIIRAICYGASQCENRLLSGGSCVRRRIATYEDLFSDATYGTHRLGVTSKVRSLRVRFQSVPASG